MTSAPCSGSPPAKGGGRAGSDSSKRRKGTKVHAAVVTLGHLLAWHVTPAEEQDREQISVRAEAVPEVTGESVELAYVDQGDTGAKPAAAAAEPGIKLEVVNLSEATRGFVLLPRRWVVERSFGWTARFPSFGTQRLAEFPSRPCRPWASRPGTDRWRPGTAPKPRLSTASRDSYRTHRPSRSIRFRFGTTVVTGVLQRQANPN
jgi:transposase